MLLEIDEAVINPDETAEQLREKLHGVVLSLHAFGGPGMEKHFGPNMTVKTIRELEAMGIVKSVTLNTRDENGHGQNLVTVSPAT